VNSFAKSRHPFVGPGTATLGPKRPWAIGGSRHSRPPSRTGGPTRVAPSSPYFDEAAYTEVRVALIGSLKLAEMGLREASPYRLGGDESAFRSMRLILLEGLGFLEEYVRSKRPELLARAWHAHNSAMNTLDPEVGDLLPPPLRDV
jgi:hypothetical protein